MNNAVVDAASVVQAATEIRVIKSCIEAFIHRYSLNGFSVVYLHNTPDGPEATSIHNVPEDFATAYVEQKFLRDDPLMLQATRMTSVHVWRHVLEHCEDTPTVRRINGLRAEFGIKDGFNVPVRTMRGVTGLVSFFGSRTAFEYQELLELQMFGLVVQMRLSELGLDQLEPNRRLRLTLREQETLKWGAMGKTSEDIADILGLTKRTVDQHFENAGRKLGTLNRVQTVVKAFQQNLITL